MAESLTIQLNNFRAFADTGNIAIRPLTILVGENSTGKTSFLAALRLAFNLGEREKAGYFNSSPFDLGSYEDIVHDSGQKSTALRFSMSVRKTVDIVRETSIGYQADRHSDVRDCCMKIFFRSRFGDVAIASIEFSMDDMKIIYEASTKWSFRILQGHEALMEQSGESGSRTMFDDHSDPRGTDLRTISYYLYDRYFAWARRDSRKRGGRDNNVRRVIAAFDAFISGSRVTYSSPPVRSVPRRVYTSADEAAQEGAHAPHELNRLKRADRKRWSRLNSGLTTFGRLSGLFTRFDIAKLTRQNAGPFQVKVTVRGRASNIVDVGYGVSQSLPIVTDLIESGTEKAAFLFQQPEVHLHPMAQAALGTLFSQYISGNVDSFLVAETHSDYLIDRLRIEIRDGDLDPDLVSLLYFEPEERSVRIHELRIDREGNVEGAPPTYRQFFIREQERVLGF